MTLAASGGGIADRADRHKPRVFRISGAGRLGCRLLTGQARSGE